MVWPVRPTRRTRDVPALSAPGPERFLVGRRCGRDVLQGDAGAVEDSDLFARLPARSCTGNHLGELRRLGRRPAESLSEGMVELADRRALLPRVDDNASGAEDC